MGLGWNAAALASHLAMLLATLMLVWQMSESRRIPNIGARLWTSPRVQWAAWAVVTAFLIERGYYVLARYAIAHGVDFWASHPVPEALALALCITIFHLAWVIARIAGAVWMHRLAIGGLGLLLLWLWVTVAAW